MNKIYNHIKLLVWGSITLCASSACSNRPEIEDMTENPIQIASIALQERTMSADMVTPNDGNYYLYYNEASVSKNLSVTIAEGSINNFGKTDILWNNLTTSDRNNGFVLSNSEDISISKSEQSDIVWGQIKPAVSPELSFSLTHRMAQVEIIVTLPKDWTIKSIALKNLKNGYLFTNADGEVKADGAVTELPIVKVGERYALLLPPQDKNIDSELSVTVNDNNGNEKRYHRLLPYAMREEIAPGQWSDIPLKFRAGRLLKLNATIKNEEINDINFTYATLTDWEKHNLGIISIRPSGVYTVNDMQKWIAAWNATPRDGNRLKKYGSEDNTGKWTFTLRANITNASIIEGFTGVAESNFYFKIADTHNYTINGVDAVALGLSGATYDVNIFATNP